MLVTDASGTRLVGPTQSPAGEQQTTWAKALFTLGMATMKTNFGELKNLACRIAPELRSSPMYVIEEFDEFPLGVLGVAAGGVMNSIVQCAT